MAKLDPFIIDLSGEWYKNPEVLHYMNRWFHDAFLRLGGETDAIEAVSVAEKYPWPQVQDADQGFNYWPQLIQPNIEKFNCVTKSVSYTAESFDFINAKANALITFPEQPADNSVIIVRNGDGSQIKLNGNGKNINGSTTGQIARKETAIEFYYFLDSDEWFAR